MKLLDEIIEKIKTLRDDGIALSSIMAEEAGDRVHIQIGSLETRDIYDHQSRKDSDVLPEDAMLDTYHES